MDLEQIKCEFIICNPTRQMCVRMYIQRVYYIYLLHYLISMESTKKILLKASPSNYSLYKGSWLIIVNTQLSAKFVTYMVFNKSERVESLTHSIACTDFKRGGGKHRERELELDLVIEKRRQK